MDVGQGRLGPATSLGPAGAGFPTLDDASLRRSIPEAAVLDAAADAAAARVADGGGAAYLNLMPFMNLAVTTGGSGRLARCGGAAGVVHLRALPADRQPCMTAANLLSVFSSQRSQPLAPCSPQCAPRRPPTGCTTSSSPCPCATCAWSTGSHAAAASSRGKTLTMRQASGPGGAMGGRAAPCTAGQLWCCSC